MSKNADVEKRIKMIEEKIKEEEKNGFLTCAATLCEEYLAPLYEKIGKKEKAKKALRDALVFYHKVIEKSQKGSALFAEKKIEEVSKKLEALESSC